MNKKNKLEEFLEEKLQKMILEQFVEGLRKEFKEYAITELVKVHFKSTDNPKQTKLDFFEGFKKTVSSQSDRFLKDFPKHEDKSVFIGVVLNAAIDALIKSFDEEINK